MKTDIKNKVALVTGANRGIGLSIVKSFIHHGAKKVYLAVRNPDNTHNIAKEFGDSVVTIQMDVTDQASVEAGAEQANDVEIVVNNAGILELSDPLQDSFKENFLKEIDTNVFGLIHMAQVFAPILEINGGAFVQLNSIVSLKNMGALTSYCASKSASYSITQGLKEVLEPKNIHVLSVHPGATHTEMITNIGFDGYSEPTVTVSEGIVSALRAGDFLLFPGKESTQVGDAYQSFAKKMIL